jgi:VanZ family protein
LSKFLKYWIPLASYCLLIFIQSSFPSLIREPDVPFFDKYLHFVAYAPLGALFCRAFTTLKMGGNKTKVAVLSILCTGLYGISDEIHQHFVPGRQADMTDAAVDFVGAACGVLIYRYVVKRRSAVAPRLAD